MNLREKKIGFIGAGNMASAMMNGLIKAEIVEKNSIYVSDLDEQKINILKEQGVNASTKNKEVIDNSDIIIVAVKPNIYPIVLKDIATTTTNQGLIIVTIAPGLSIEYVKSFFEFDVKVVRTMPNTPALVGEGMTVTCYESPVTKEEYELVNMIFTSIGKVESLDEKYMNEVVAVNGSSPAYVYIMIEAMADAAVMRGIPRDMAYRLVSQSVLGSAKMVLETEEHPAKLKDMVCSPGGTTIQAVYELEKSGFRASLMNAMESCTEKAITLGKRLRGEG